MSNSLQQLGHSHFAKKCPESADEGFNDLEIKAELSTSSRFPVLIAYSQNTEMTYALKIYRKEKGCKISDYYKNESQFTDLCHPNVSAPLFCEENKVFYDQTGLFTASYALTEYNPNRNLLEALFNKPNKISDKLARTIFRQVLDGLEFLHNRGVAHLDIKLENLMFDKNFNIRIIDFDLSHFSKGTSFVEHLGSSDYRAPELIPGSKIKIKDFRPCDIYSVGILLFILKSGGKFPFLEETENPEQEADSVDSIYHTLRKKFKSNKGEFWNLYISKFKHDIRDFTTTFRNLFEGMCEFNPDKRMSIAQIRQTIWVKGEVYPPKQFKQIIAKMIEQNEA